MHGRGVFSNKTHQIVIRGWLGHLVITFAVLATILIWPGDIDQTVAVLSTPDWPLFVALGVLSAGLRRAGAD